MDDFRIHNRALGSDEIMMLASGEEPVRTIQTVEQPQAVETMVGTAPILPDKVNVTLIMEPRAENRLPGKRLRLHSMRKQVRLR